MFSKLNSLLLLAIGICGVMRAESADLQKGVAEMGQGIVPNGGQIMENSIQQEAKDMGNWLVIKDKNQFLELEKTEAKNFSFEGIDLDEKFSGKFGAVVPYEFDSVAFKNCKLAQYMQFGEILDGYSFNKLSIISSGLITKDLIELLIRTNPHALRELNISGNNFEKKDEELIKEFSRSFWHQRHYLYDINISNNGLQEKTVRTIEALWCPKKKNN